MVRLQIAPVMDPTDEDTTSMDPHWVVVVHNDDINTMEYVIYVFKKLLQVKQEEAYRLMMKVHEEGKAAVWAGPRERCEAIAASLHGWSIWATIAKG